MHRAFTGTAAAAALLALLPATTFAHATLEVQEATAGSRYKAVLRVPHGCAGSPTTAVRIQLPDGVVDAKPMPKAGWELDIVRAKLDEPYDLGHGNFVTERVSEVHWTGGRLLDEHYDEFVVRVHLPDLPGETLYFPTVQECVEGVHRWIEIPAAGASGSGLDEPAPRLSLRPRS